MGALTIPSGWTDERIEALKKRLAQGWSAAQIAKELRGGLSRNAVIGKIHRLGLIRPGTAANPRAARKTYASQPKAPPPPPKLALPLRVAPETAAEVAPFKSKAPTLAPIPEQDRGRHYCRWPIGDPKDTGYADCGRPVGRDGRDRPQTYCDAHRPAGLSAKQPTARSMQSLAGYVAKTDGVIDARSGRLRTSWQ